MVGSLSDYLRSAEVALLMTEFNIVGSDSYSTLLNYLDTIPVSTTGEEAMQARIRFGLGQSTGATMATILGRQNTDGGFGALWGYASDPLTTAEVALAIGVTGEGTPEDLAQALASITGSIEPDGAMRLTPGSDPSYYLMNKTLQSLAPFRAYSVSDGTTSVSVQSRIDLVLSFLRARYSDTTERLYGTSDAIDYAMTAYSFDLYDVHSDTAEALANYVRDNQNQTGSFGASLAATIESRALGAGRAGIRARRDARGGAAPV